VPVYNGQATVGRCIEALLAQDYPADRREIIIVDNNSTDGTSDIVGRYPVILVYERAVQTSYAARNCGIRHARGDIVAFTDADCIPHGDWLTHLGAGFTESVVVGVAGAVLPATTSNLIASFLAETNPVRSRAINGLWYVITANAAYRRGALLAVGGFRSELFTAGDIDLSLRLQLEGQGFIVSAPEAIVRHEYGTTWHEVWARFRRYGYSEITLDYLLKDRWNAQVSAPNRIIRLGAQLRALLTYGMSFLWRLRTIPRQGWVAQYNLRPVYLALAESASIWGKLVGMNDRRRLSASRRPQASYGATQPSKDT
jgi:cellulose synthase/poly-beta-1,6-N-acetylglucosamine synthase-like glycosyltransferase